MSKIERRMLLQSTKGVTVNLDPDTHKVIKAWAKKQGITIVQAIRIMAQEFFKSQVGIHKEKEPTNDIVQDKLRELASVIRKAQEKPPSNIK